MKKVKVTSFVLMCIVCLFVFNNSVEAYSLNTLYLLDSNRYMYTVDHTSGVPTLVGQNDLGVIDIAFAPDNTLYGVNWDQLMTIDPNTGLGTIVGTVGYNSTLICLAVGPTGEIFTSDITNGDIIKIDPLTGNGTIIGTIGGGLALSGDLAFDASGILYATLKGAGVNDYLATINTSTGAASLIGDTGFERVFGLSFRNGILYGATNGGDFLSINTSTGIGSLIGSTGLTSYGMATSSPVPEPGTFILLGSGLVGFAIIGYRRRKKA